ncbi:hypothetical protein T06_16541 [Trichinella sp. T6]|nr:hypothetical protein T06_16541 [Trichinella sp. T6]
MVKCEAGTELPSTTDRRKQWTIYLFVTTPKKNNGCYTEQRWLLFGFCIANETWMPQHYMAILASQVYCWIIDGKSSITKKSPAAETKAGFVDALVRILMHYEKEILAFRLHLYLVTYPVIVKPLKYMPSKFGTFRIIQYRRAASWHILESPPS